MKKQNSKRKRQERRTKKILFTTGITAVVFVVATYAWFIGTMQASVDAFEIDIKSSEGLTLSLDGENFSNQITIGENEITTSLVDSYADNKNKWTGADGLMPISTTGELDEANSVLKLYSKTSISSSKGGYMLRANQIDNSSEEGDGYIAFDLFVKNKSGDIYEENFDIKHDEGVYLTTDSIMKMIQSSGGADVEENAAGDGVQNSMRIAFVQIGRAQYSKGKEVFQGITCNSVESGVTTLCNKDPDSGDGRGYTWNIWEPNDTKHTTASISRFTRICKNRNDADNYEGVCDPISSGTESKTYAINSNITSEDKVNVYDGHNTYSSAPYLKEVNYFTDTMKNTADDGRPEIFYLTPNSVTKIRVYIYIEGQDVDNYDIDSEDKKIKASFGFTKDKFDTAGMA